jgi:hypothetical protein
MDGGRSGARPKTKRPAGATMNATRCSLGVAEMAAQLERYRELGQLAAVTEHEPGRIVVRFLEDPPPALLELTMRVERGCCPFISLEFEPRAHRLTISAEHPDHQPSLEAIAQALIVESGGSAVVSEGCGCR